MLQALDPVSISIHALRVEGDDWDSAVQELNGMNFYPRPPCGGRRFRWHRRKFPGQFLSTPSVWRATFRKLGLPFRPLLISIHALRVEGDTACRSLLGGTEDFYPRPPCGGRPAGSGHCPR